MNERYLLDSNVLMLYFKKRTEAIELIATLVDKGTLYISSLSLMELRAGWTDTQTAYLLPRLLAMVKVQDVTQDMCIYTGELLQKYQRTGVQLSPVDTLLAASAIISDMVMVIYNRKDFEPIKELQLYMDL